MTREQVIQSILDEHGKDAVYIFATGYIARTGFKLCWGKYTAFYMLGSMGLAPAIGDALSDFVDKEVVVINGDGAEAMIPTRFNEEKTVYVLENQCHESTGGQEISDWPIDDYAKIIEIEPSPPDPRIPVSPKEVIDAFIHGLSS